MVRLDLDGDLSGFIADWDPTSWDKSDEWYYISMRPKTWIECGGSMIGANTLNGKFDKSSAMHRKFC